MDSERHGPVSAAALAPNFWGRLLLRVSHPTDAATAAAGRENSSYIVLFGRFAPKFWRPKFRRRNFK